MNLKIFREELLKQLHLFSSIAEKKQTLPILSNVLLCAEPDSLSVTATDLEVELQMNILLSQPATTTGEVTVPAKKLLDIFRSLPEHALIEFNVENNKLFITSGQSRFSLLTLPAEEYPSLDETETLVEFTVDQKDLRFLLHRCLFAMAQQDVRYYLNGMLLEIKQGLIRSVATDGHRLAINSIEAALINNAVFRVIIPRKGVTELVRLLDDTNAEITISIMTNHIRISRSHFTFTSKLIEGRFPDYERILPKHGDKTILIPREELRQSLARASILSNEKFRGVRLQLRNGILRILANNPDAEEAQEEMLIDYQQENLDIGFNVKYLIDIFDVIDDKDVTLTFSDPKSSILVEGSSQGEGTNKGNSLFVVMPMNL
jgi:DNA polymerase III subunit beta